MPEDSEAPEVPHQLTFDEAASEAEAARQEAYVSDVNEQRRDQDYYPGAQPLPTARESIADARSKLEALGNAEDKGASTLDETGPDRAA